jgi:anionic cell wall polymer biosynthesis LytR-Cps2A-Psr (LCP) family protein
VPGLGQAVQRRWRRALVFGVPTAAVLLLAAWAIGHDQATLIDWSVSSNVLRSLCVAGLLWAIVCFASADDAARAAWPTSTSRRQRSRRAGAASMAIVTVAALLPGMAFAWVAVRQDALLDTVFGQSGEAKVAVPSPLDDLGLTTPPTTALDTTAATTASSVTATSVTATSVTGTSVSASSRPEVTRPRVTAESTTVPGFYAGEIGRWNIALLGGDAGPRRWSLRTDTMIVVSIDRQTGDIAGISVPRNLQHLPMPPGPLRDRFPHGFDDLANALWPYVSTHPDLHLDPSEAIKGALAELLGIPIHNYVLVDMAGFVKIIDALGGVTVDLSARVPLVPNMDGKTKEAPFVGPGAVKMNGTMALSFVRTRNADSDYQRMKRQRCLLAAVGRETSPSDLARNYPSLATAVEGAFRSDIPREKLGDLVRLFVRVDVGQARTLVLVPPVIQPSHPDIRLIRALVTTALDPAAAAKNSAITAPKC